MLRQMISRRHGQMADDTTLRSLLRQLLAYVGNSPMRRPTARSQL